MIRYTQGNILEADVDAIVNTVNTEGIMGKGLALQFKRKFPENFKAYAAACKRGEVSIGKLFVFAHNTLAGNKYLINFPTKTSWRNKSNMVSITQGLVALRKQIIQHQIKSIAIPPLGCGLGGLLWPDVKAEIEKHLHDLLDVDIVVYEPLCGPNPSPVATKKSTRLTPVRAMLIRCFDMYMRLVPSTDITFVEVHKLAYILQEICKINLKLNFRAWQYGPYAHNLSHVLAVMEGVWIEGYGDGTHKAFDTIHLLPAARSTRYYNLSTDYNAALSKIDKIFSGFESPVGLELLATTHWLVEHEHIAAKLEVMQSAIASWGKKEGHPEWGKRKLKYFMPKTLKLALERISNFQ